MKSNMYPLSVAQRSPHVGCLFDCSYCRSTFQRQSKRRKNKCELCYRYEPHTHMERLKQTLPKTRYMQFVSLCLSGDVAFCPKEQLQEIMDYATSYPRRTFLIQSKRPNTFERVKIPSNVVIGTTIETNKTSFTELADRIYTPDYFPVNSSAYSLRRISSYSEISKAPHPTSRAQQIANLDHKAVMLTCEPLLAFDLQPMLDIAEQVQPTVFWLGMDSHPKQNFLPEPTYTEVKLLHWELSRLGFPVILKNIRLAWYEK